MADISYVSSRRLKKFWDLIRGRVLNTYEEITANTKDDMIMGAKAGSQIIRDMQWFIANGFLPEPYKSWVALVPALSGLSGPNGEMVYQGVYNSTYTAWHVFDNDPSTSCPFSVTADVKTTFYIGYRFNSKVAVKRVHLVQTGNDYSRAIKQFRLQASDDGVAWHNVGVVDTHAATGVYDEYFEFTASNTPHYYWRIQDTRTEAYPPYIVTLQFYSWGG